ncbi:MAG: ester cyclase [Ignavibacteriales bacterium]
MKPADMVEEFLTAIEKNNFPRAESYLSENFKVTGVGPEPLGMREFLGVHRALGKGMPDFRFNYRIVKEKGNKVNLTVKITGTHSMEMPAPVPGLKNIAPTNKTVTMPEEPLEITVSGSKIEKLQLEHVTGGGLQGILRQLGVKMPAEVHHH